MKNELLGFLGLCRKAGKLTFGFDAVIKKAKEKRSCLVLIAKDFSCRSLRSAKEKLNNFGAQVIILDDVSVGDLCSILKKETGIVLVEDVNFKNGIRRLLD